MRLHFAQKSLRHERGHAAGREDALLRAPRRPHISLRYQWLSPIAFCSALPTPPPQRVCERGRQSFTSNRINSSHFQDSLWGRRGPNSKIEGWGMKGREEGMETERGMR